MDEICGDFEIISRLWTGVYSKLAPIESWNDNLHVMDIPYALRLLGMAFYSPK